MLRFSVFGLIALLAAGSWAAPAHAQVRRCVQPGGDVTYTDQRCASIGAEERAASHDSVGSSRLYRGTCPRTTRDLMFEMRQAIAAGDVNHLASLYHWAGMSSGAANTVMRQLETLVQQPLVAVAPVMAAPVAMPAAASLAAPTASPVASPIASAAVRGTAAPPPARRWGATPVAVRVEQTLAGSTTPSRTVFQLHQYFGCMWIRDGSPS